MTPKIHMLCLILINSVPLNLFYVFGCSFRMLAVILVSDFYFYFFSLAIPLKVCKISGILKSKSEKKAWSWFNCFKIVTIQSFLQGQSHWCQKPRSYWGTCMHQSAVSRQHFETWFRMSVCLNLAWLFLHLIWEKVWKMSGVFVAHTLKKWTLQFSSSWVWNIV